MSKVVRSQRLLTGTVIGVVAVLLLTGALFHVFGDVAPSARSPTRSARAAPERRPPPRLVVPKHPSTSDGTGEQDEGSIPEEQPSENPLLRIRVVESGEAAPLRGGALQLGSSSLGYRRVEEGTWEVYGDAVVSPFGITIEAPGFITVNRMVDWPPPDSHLDVVMHRAAYIVGKASYEDGGPASYATVTSAAHHARADPAGDFVLGPVPVGARVGLACVAEGGYLKRPAEVTVRSDETRVDLTLERGLKLAVVVLDLEEQPIPGAHVTMIRSALTPPHHRVERDTNARGVASAENLPPGEYLLHVDGKAFNSLRVGPVHISGVVPAERITIHLNDDLHRISGTVVDPVGTPVPDAVITLEPFFGSLRAISDDRGRFVFEHVRRRYRERSAFPVRVRDSIGATVSLHGWSGADDVAFHLDEAARVVLARSGAIRGRVVDVDGEPVDEFSVEFRCSPASADHELLQRAGSTGAFRRKKARFMSENVMAIPGRLVIRRHGSGVTTEVPVTPRAGKVVDVGDVVVQSAGLTIRPILRPPVGVDPSSLNGRVWARKIGGGVVSLARFFRGKPTTQRVEPGDYEVFAKIDGFFARVDRVSGGLGEARVADLRLQRLAPVELVLSGRPRSEVSWRCIFVGNDLASFRHHFARGWDAVTQSWDWRLRQAEVTGVHSGDRSIPVGLLPPGPYRVLVEGDGVSVESMFVVPDGGRFHIVTLPAE